MLLCADVSLWRHNLCSDMLHYCHFHAPRVDDSLGISSLDHGINQTGRGEKCSKPSATESFSHRLDVKHKQRVWLE